MSQLESSGDFRAMREDDLDEVMVLELASYEFPWTQGIFLDCLRNHYNNTMYVQQGEILAYTITQYVVDECHLLNICVKNSQRGKGLGEKMVQYLMNQARQNDMGSIFLEVRSSNKAAICLYDKLGFNEIGLRRDYYPDNDGREDALVLAKEIF